MLTFIYRLLALIGATSLVLIGIRSLGFQPNAWGGILAGLTTGVVLGLLEHRLKRSAERR